MERGRYGEFATLLAQRRIELEAALAAGDRRVEAIRSARSDTPADDEHDPEGSTLSGEWSAAIGLRDAAGQELAQIALAEARLDGGTYGVCEICGSEIPLERLRARPAAARCVRCASP
ncbi:TraR/DksA family transcriptional regulator [Microbacterium rhizomatis]|uniref:Molecular chaperone DnaK n=1 Tax=Microbacterium rhizomatis TaxID=1631477 RepID=A0A5J5J6W9_9MICO|nr:TraR/DksA C4-type zinc finger protein [Microbacterium rhizomatis]KAA9110874.1 molecular chaperone DnaK [Microbacterium rhizomatis]